MSLELPAISLHQPWASLLFAEHRRKTHETRHWQAPERLIGKRMIIHAAKKRIAFADLDRALAMMCREAFGPSPLEGLPYGAAIGTARLVYSRPMKEVGPADDDDAIAGHWAWDRYAWRFDAPALLEPPLRIPGRQMIFSATIARDPGAGR